MSLPKEDRTYTYQDYLLWSEDERIEIIDGRLYMQAAPSRTHQKMLSELHRQLANYLIGKACEVYPGPFEVVLCFEEENQNESRNVFEPDITVVCDTSKLDESGCKGAPDMVIEIISPSTGRKDKMEKFHKYEQAGVQEYWIVEPQEKIVTVFILEESLTYGRPSLYSDEQEIQVSIFDDLRIDLKTVFTYS